MDINDDTWITTNVTQGLLRQVKAEMEGSDRANAVVGGAFVELHLTHFLKSRMVKDRKVTEEMFAPGRAFGDFGAKVDLGYLIGVYSKRAHKELITIRRIRNYFSHQFDLNSFERDDIRDHCHNLTLSQSKRIVMASSGDLTLAELKVEREDEIPWSDFAFETFPPSPRERFATACRFYVAAFSVLSNQSSPDPRTFVVSESMLNVRLAFSNLSMESNNPSPHPPRQLRLPTFFFVNNTLGKPHRIWWRSSTLNMKENSMVIKADDPTGSQFIKIISTSGQKVVIELGEPSTNHIANQEFINATVDSFRDFLMKRYDHALH